jgi:transcriptional regulator with XRE-family HTH domain
MVEVTKRLATDQVQVDVGRRIGELRAARRMTQEHLAERCGVSARYVQQVEAGEQNLTLRSLVAFANALEASMTVLFEPPLSAAPPPPVRTKRPRR